MLSLCLPYFRMEKGNRQSGVIQNRVYQFIVNCCFLWGLLLLEQLIVFNVFLSCRIVMSKENL
jgi:hypothetical protein